MVLNLLAGITSLVSLSGVGRLLIRPLRPLPLHWYLALAMLAGFAACSVSVQVLAIAGSGRTGFRLLAAGMVVLGLLGHWIGRGRYTNPPWRPAAPFRTLMFGLLGLVLIVLVLISLAPSTKIDELYYHMLTGRRVLEDHGLRVYQLPYEQAIVPQMGYQIAETVFHATNTADAGNILSLGFGMALWLLILRRCDGGNGTHGSGFAGHRGQCHRLVPSRVVRDGRGACIRGSGHFHWVGSGLLSRRAGQEQ